MIHGSRCVSFGKFLEISTNLSFFWRETIWLKYLNVYSVRVLKMTSRYKYSILPMSTLWYLGRKENIFGDKVHAHPGQTADTHTHTYSKSRQRNTSRSQKTHQKSPKSHRKHTRKFYEFISRTTHYV